MKNVLKILYNSIIFQNPFCKIIYIMLNSIFVKKVELLHPTSLFYSSSFALSIILRRA